MHERLTPSLNCTPRGRRKPVGAAEVAAFVSDVEPLLERNDLQGLFDCLSRRYGQRRICQFLACEDADARKVAALCLSLVGTAEAIRELAEHLRDADPMVNQMAEHALWSIWFRGGTPEANAHLLRGSEALNDRQIERAHEHFTAALTICPDFPEAYNQRAIGHYLCERFDESIADGRMAVRLMPCHFGAWAGKGHCYAQRGEREAALRCYHRAVLINPHLDCVIEMIRELEGERPTGFRSTRSDCDTAPGPDENHLA